MNSFTSFNSIRIMFAKVIAAYGLALLLLPGCASDDSGSQVSGGVYYGVGFNDPWYYGSGYYDNDIIVTPPDRPDRPPHVEQPIARPPRGQAPSARPMPSIPSAPRPSARR
jgi:hypothetical protein